MLGRIMESRSFDVRCRMLRGIEIENVQLLAIHLTVSHTGENIANSVHRLSKGMLDMVW